MGALPFWAGALIDINAMNLSLNRLEGERFEKDYEMVIAVSAIEPETPVILQAPDETIQQGE